MNTLSGLAWSVLVSGSSQAVVLTKPGATPRLPSIMILYQLYHTHVAAVTSYPTRNFNWKAMKIYMTENK